MADLTIAGRTIDLGSPCLIVAEIGVNHDGSFDRARDLIELARDAGADCAKLQTFRAEDVAVAEAPKAPYQHRTTSMAESQLEMLKRLELSSDEQHALVEFGAQVGIPVFSAPATVADAQLLASWNVEALKIASFQLTEDDFLTAVAALGKPILLSTGMATLEEVDHAHAVLEAAAPGRTVLMQCTSEYPCALENAHVDVVRAYRERFGSPVGFSDHTIGTAAALAAVSLGARVVEKHFTNDRSLPGPDHAASADPMQFAEMVRMIREIERVLGSAHKTPTAGELQNRPCMRRGLMLTSAVRRGGVFESSALKPIRPATGIPASLRHVVAGRVAKRDLPAGHLLTDDDVQ